MLQKCTVFLELIIIGLLGGINIRDNDKVPVDKMAEAIAGNKTGDLWRIGLKGETILSLILLTVFIMDSDIAAVFVIYTTTCTTVFHFKNLKRIKFDVILTID